MVCLVSYFSLFATCCCLCMLVPVTRLWISLLPLSHVQAEQLCFIQYGWTILAQPADKLSWLPEHSRPMVLAAVPDAVPILPRVHTTTSQPSIHPGALPLAPSSDTRTFTSFAKSVSGSQPSISRTPRP
ncbi:hypothetical protein V8C86DRAFT_1057916 [Haematococcus lacustris]